MYYNQRCAGGRLTFMTVINKWADTRYSRPRVVLKVLWKFIINHYLILDILNTLKEVSNTLLYYICC